MNLTEYNKKTLRAQIDEYLNKYMYSNALDLIKRYKQRGYTITRSIIKKIYKLKDKDINNFIYCEMKNPHYSSASPMKLYLIKQVVDSVLMKRKLKIKRILNRVYL